MVQVFYYADNQDRAFLERREECPPRIGEQIELHTNQAFPDQITFYIVKDVITPLAAWTPGAEVKKIILHAVAQQGEILTGAGNEVESP